MPVFVCSSSIWCEENYSLSSGGEPRGIHLFTSGSVGLENVDAMESLSRMLYKDIGSFMLTGNGSANILVFIYRPSPVFSFSLKLQSITFSISSTEYTKNLV